MTRFFLFLICYGLIVMSLSQLIIYLNYRTIGYGWDAVFYYMIRTADFMILVFATIVMMIIVFVRGPFGSPFSSE